MKNKRLLNLALFAVLQTSVLTGCGSTNNDVIELKIGFWPENTETEDLAMYNQWKEAFETAYPQYKITGQPYTYSTETIGTVALSRQLPTVFQTWFTEPLKLKEAGYIRSIDSQIKSHGWDSKMDVDMKDSLTFDNEIYGIPRDGYGLGLLVNMRILWEDGIIEKDKDGNYIIFDDNGKSLLPTTFEEIYELGGLMRENGDSSSATMLICTTNKNGGWQFSNFAWNYGAELQRVENGKVVSNLASNEAVSALEWIKEMANGYDGEQLLLNGTSIAYDDWYGNIGSRVAMAVVGSDVLDAAYMKGQVSMDDLAFMQMPTGDGTHHYSLYGGTPYVFAADASDEQVEGVLKFFEYIGRSPDVTEISKSAMVYGNQVSVRKNQPILPKIRPWINAEYVAYQKELEDEYVTVKMAYYNDFFNNIQNNKHAEVAYAAQQMYEILDEAVYAVLDKPQTANCKALLTTANQKMQSYLDENINK